MRFTKITWLLSGLALAACSTTEKPPKPTYSPTRYANVKPTERELTTQWVNTERRSASIETGNYRHVLAHKNIGNAENISMDEEQPTEPTVKTTIHPLDAETRSYSLYEMTRWERYCGKGGKTDKRDWLFFEKEHYAVPAELSGTCKAPGFRQDAYKDAWVKQCTGQALSESQRNIVATTLQPSKCKRGK